MNTWATDDLATIPPPLDPDAYGTIKVPVPGPPALPDLPVRSAATFYGVPVPPRPWLVPDIIPKKTPTLLTGNGGDGKSLAALQLSVAVSTGTDWIGTLPEAGPVLYLSAEDDEAELHRRLVDIVASRGMSLSDLDQLHICSLAGRDALLAVPVGRSGGVMAATPLWAVVCAKIEEIKPCLVILDTQADVFGGNEIVRAEVRQFVSLLRGVAITHDLALLLIGHPSLAGMASGSGTSGSTAWSNSVRSRLYLERVKGEDGDEPDPNVRTLRVMKANYAATGTEIRIRWMNGAFSLDGAAPSGFQRVAAEAEAEAKFMSILQQFEAQGRNVSHQPSSTYAPKAFAKHPDAGGISKQGFIGAMERLFRSDKIKVVSFGPPSRPRSKIVAVLSERKTE